MYGLLVIVIIIAGILAYVKFALPNVGPSPDITIARTPLRLMRGKYLVNHVAGCLYCHSMKDTTLFGSPIRLSVEGGGGEVFGREDGFPGTIISRNITPYKLGSWTDGDLFRAITMGVTKEGKALFPLMPYLQYAQMDTEDLYSIIAYIRSIKPVKMVNLPTSVDFPINLIMNTIPAKYHYHPRPLRSDSVGYGKYLVNMGVCADCHTPALKDKNIPGMDFAGGRVFQERTGGKLTSANITPDISTGIGSWSKEAFIQRFKAFGDIAYHPGPAPEDAYNPVMPWQYYGGMSREDLGDIYAYLRTIKPVHHLVVNFVR